MPPWTSSTTRKSTNTTGLVATEHYGTARLTIPLGNQKAGLMPLSLQYFKADTFLYPVYTRTVDIKNKFLLYKAEKCPSTFY